MQTNHIFILIHSPRVGPLTWSSVANELHQNDIEANLVVLPRPNNAPFYPSQAEAIAKTVNELPAHSLPILVGHSGASALLPAARQLIDRPLTGYILVDSHFPQDGKSRLELHGDPAETERMRQEGSDGKLPVWSEADLLDVIAPPLMRQMLVEEMRPTPLALYEEAIPVFPGWPDCPGGYIRFTPAYEVDFQQAQEHGWTTRVLEGTHFQMFNRPADVANVLVKIVDSWGV
ncbi:MAG: alpha/beta hydrolase [Anaerolineaceae bacterium]|nr:alpha/beta hydrolase [Anaerolineaceae bacterium]